MTPAFIIDKFDERILKIHLQSSYVYDIIYSEREISTGSLREAVSGQNGKKPGGC